MNDNTTKIEKEYREASKISGIEWKNNSKTKGMMHVTDDIQVKFDFSREPELSIMPKKFRKVLPPITDLIPELVIWDEKSDLSWFQILLKVRDGIMKTLENHDARSNENKGRYHVSKEMIRSLLKICAEFHPNERLFLLKMDSSGILSQVIVPPGGKGGRRMAFLVPTRLPHDPDVKGTFHSHPSGSGAFSRQDKEVFKQYEVNIIAYYPYLKNNFRAYDNKGMPIDIELV
ncbi:MAG: hypothetical protein ACTSVI_01200 [Promethearchaeota archaeon]